MERQRKIDAGTERQIVKCRYRERYRRESQMDRQKDSEVERNRDTKTERHRH